jgi:hypothetical protein
LVSPCAGTAKSEQWTLRFDQNQQGWVVSGRVSGEQATLAIEDQRYVSDDGSVSFLLRAGGTPSKDGWQITFDVIEGTMGIDGDNDKDGEREVGFDTPGDPVFFHYTVGPTPASWKEIDDRAFVLVPSQGSNTVNRIDPQEGGVDASWF